ncbi:MAG: restriction endonuclease subunit S, partial [Candidatus Bipolaricaulia bacterium]
LGISSLVAGRLDLGQSAHLSDADHERWTRRVTPQPGDVVFSYETRLGEAAIIPDGLRCCLGRRMALMRPDPAKVDSRFLLYAYLGPEFQATIRERTVHGSTVERILLTEFPDFPITVPDLETQRWIARVLGALDDRIELNRRMSRTLESIARTIFKSWFVDFGPVRREHGDSEPGILLDPVSAFPHCTHEEARVPAGWSRGCLQDLIETMLGGDWGSGSATEECSARVSCLRGADVPALQEGGIGSPPVRFLRPRSFEKRRLRAGDLVLEVSGGSPTQSTGRCAVITDAVVRRLGDQLVCSNFCRAIRLRDRDAAWYVYLWLRWVYDSGLLFDFENGTTGIKNLAIADFALNPVLPIPPADVLSAFNRHVESCLRLRETLSQESEHLASARDELLPRLLSGALMAAEGPQ